MIKKGTIIYHGWTSHKVTLNWIGLTLLDIFHIDQSLMHCYFNQHTCIWISFPRTIAEDNYNSHKSLPRGYIAQASTWYGLHYPLPTSMLTPRCFENLWSINILLIEFQNCKVLWRVKQFSITESQCRHHHNEHNKQIVVVYFLRHCFVILPFQTAADGDRVKPINPIQNSEQKHVTPADFASPTPAKITKLDISAGAGMSKDVPENSQPMTGNTMNSTLPHMYDVIATAAKIKVPAQVRYILLCLIN